MLVMCISLMHVGGMEMQQRVATSGVTIRFGEDVRRQVAAIAQAEHRSTAAYIESLVERDLEQRAEQDRVVHVYAAWDAPEWSGTVEPGEHETGDEHAERTDVLRQLFGHD